MCNFVTCFRVFICSLFSLSVRCGSICVCVKLYGVCLCFFVLSVSC